MEQNLSFDLMPYRIDQIYEELMNIKSILNRNFALAEEVPKHVSIDGAVKFLEKEAYYISKSSIYKMTAKRKIPHSKFNGKLVFDIKELTTWVENQLNKNIYGK